MNDTRARGEPEQHSQQRAKRQQEEQPADLARRRQMQPPDGANPQPSEDRQQIGELIRLTCLC